MDRSAGRDRPARGLAGDEALVDFRIAADHHAVGRHPLARPHQQAVARLERRDRHHHDLAVLLEAVGDLRLQRREIAGDRAGLAPHGVIEIAAAQQKEQQHHRGIEIGVLGVVDGLDHATCRAPGSRRARSARPC